MERPAHGASRARSGRALGLLIGATFLVLTVAVLMRGIPGRLSTGAPTPPPPALDAPSESHSQEPDLEQTRQTAADALGSRDRVSGSDRRSFNPRQELIVAVHGASGDGILGAQVSIAAPASEDPLAAATHAATGEDGRAAIAVPHLPVPASLALWVSHPGHSSAWRTWDPTADSAENAIEWELAVSEGLTVRVLDANGEPVSNAEVIEWAASDGDALAAGRSSAPSAADGFPASILACFERRLVTSPEGWVAAHPCKFPLAFRARAPFGVSDTAFVEPHSGEVELRLRSLAKALGTVYLPAGHGRTDELRVDVLRRPRGHHQRGEHELVGSARVRGDGAWGPVELGSDPASELVFRLHGGGLIAVERVLDPRTTDPPFIVDFAPRPGRALSLFVFERIEDQLVGIPGARVEYRGQVEADGGIGIANAWCDEDGRVELEGCPEGMGTLHVSAIGYSNATRRSFHVPREDVEEVELARGGRLSGRCTYGGEPVESFSVHVWTELANHGTTHRFHDREDGTYLIEGAPIGQLQAIASSPRHPECKVQGVEVLPEEVAHLDFELPDAVVGRGRVIAADTGDPLPSARIQPMASTALIVFDERGPDFPVGPDGSFELETFPPKECSIRVEADGYPAVRVDGRYSESSGLEFGEIALTNRQDLTVHIVADAELDTSVFWFKGSGQQPLPYQRFGPDGVLVYESISPGRYLLQLVHPNGDYVGRWVKLVAGVPWELDFELDVGMDLSVSIQPPAGEGIPEGAGLFLEYRSSREDPMRIGIPIPPDGEVVVQDCNARELWLSINLPDGRRIGSAHRRFEPDETRHVDVRLTDRELVLWCLDVEGNPLPETQVDLADAQSELPTAFYAVSDAAGRAVFTGLCYDEVLISASHAVAGSSTNRVLQIASEGRTEHEVFLDGGQPLSLRAVDGDAPIAGASLRLHPSVRTIYIGDRNTDLDGIARWDRMNPGRYSVTVEHYGLWPTWQEFEFADADTPIDIHVRRRGSLRVTFLDSAGLPLTGAALNLTSVEYQEPVDSWLEQHRLEASPADMTTDPHGQCTVRGLPHGQYVLQLTHPSGETITRDVVVPPAALGEAFVRQE